MVVRILLRHGGDSARMAPFFETPGAQVRSSAFSDGRLWERRGLLAPIFQARHKEARPGCSLPGGSASQSGHTQHGGGLGGCADFVPHPPVAGAILFRIDIEQRREFTGTFFQIVGINIDHQGDPIPFADSLRMTSGTKKPRGGRLSYSIVMTPPPLSRSSISASKSSYRSMRGRSRPAQADIASAVHRTACRAPAGWRQSR